MRQLLCRVAGHRYEDVPWQYVQGETTLANGEKAPVTWACCEVCSRCGGGVWLPF